MKKLTKDLQSLKISLEPIKTIKLNPKNPRKNEETTEQIVASIEAFGYCDPIIVRKKNRTIIAGNNRYKALKSMGADKVPVIFMDLSEVDADVLMVTHNKLTEKTPWDFPKLADLFVEFDQLDVNMDLTGFDAGEIGEIVLGPRKPDDSGDSACVLDYMSFLVTTGQRREIEARLDCEAGENRTEQLLCLIRKQK